MLSLSVLTLGHQARAQNTSGRPAAAPAPSPFVVPNNANGVNILIIALDDLADQVRLQRASGGGLAPSVPSSPLPSQLPMPIGPDLPPTAPAGADPPAIRPAATYRVPNRAAVEWRVLAKKAKVDKHADVFRAVPQAPPAYPVIPNRSGDSTLPPVASDGVDASPLPPSGEVPVPALAVPGVAPIVGDVMMEPKPPGVAQIAAAPLRRALLRMGFRDVLNTAVDGSTIVRALNGRRLSSRVIDTLQLRSAQYVSASLAVNPTVAPNAAGASNAALQAAATQAAAQVGQALGYRAVLLVGVLPPDLAGQPGGRLEASNASQAAGQSTLTPNPLALPQSPTTGASSSDTSVATFTMLIVDAVRETSEVTIFDETGSGELARNETAAATSAAVVSKSVGAWPIVTIEDKNRYASGYLAAARTALAAGDWQTAQDKLNQVLALDPNRAEAALLMGDVLAAIDPAAAITSYRRAVTQNVNDGATWAKIAIAHTVGNKPDWPRALEAGRKALAAKFDSAQLRQAMATAQLGRADLFRHAGQIDNAEKAESDARQHLDRALVLAPEDPGVMRLMTRQMVMQSRFREAVKVLDRIAVQYPDDAEIQTQYATSLLEIGGREEDAFVAWARVWKLTGQQAAPADASRYRRLSEGFDQRIASLGKKAMQLTSGVASNNTPREAALLQLSRYKEDMAAAVTAIKIIQPGIDGQGGAVHASRVLSADLMSQALESHQLYLETGQDIYRTRAGELNRQAMIRLNVARGGQG